MIPPLMFVVLLAFLGVGWWIRGIYDRRVEQDRAVMRDACARAER